MVVVYGDESTDVDYWFQWVGGRVRDRVHKGSSGTLLVTERSDDWRHYEGTLEAVLVVPNAVSRKVQLTNGYFSITLP